MSLRWAASAMLVVPFVSALAAPAPASAAECGPGTVYDVASDMCVVAAPAPPAAPVPPAVPAEWGAPAPAPPALPALPPISVCPPIPFVPVCFPVS